MATVFNSFFRGFAVGVPGKRKLFGERRSSGMSDFSSFHSEMSDMKLVTTKSRLKSGVCKKERYLWEIKRNIHFG